MKKMSVSTLLILTFAFSAQLSFAMDCFRDAYQLCCAPKKEPKYEPIPKKEPKIITPIEAHYDAIVEIFPEMEKKLVYGDVADLVEIVDNAKTQYKIKERDLGLFAFKQNHPKNYNKGASILIALIERYNKEIEEKKVPMVTRAQLRLNVKLNEHKQQISCDCDRETSLLLKSIGLEIPTNMQPKINPITKLAVHAALLIEHSGYWDPMANMLYGNTKDSNESVTLDELPL